MNIVFTICSVNYLAGAKVLWQSIFKNDPDSNFVCIIADKINGRVNVEYFEGVDQIEVEQLEIPDLHELIRNYNIIEFNTAIKPFAVKYLAKKYNAKKIIYFDPDIIVFNSLDLFWNNLNNYDFIVTPHITKPITNKTFYEHQKGALNTGVFNLGFIAININENTTEIINWWAYHMREHGHSNSSKGEFYDQKIMNLLPIFSDNLLIEKHPGCNVAGWNIHEREITKNNDGYLVNNKPLMFYHFSGLVSDPSVDLISRYNNLKLSQNTSVKEIVSLYRDSLSKNDQKKLSQLNCAFDLKPNIHTTSKWQMFKHKIKTYFK